MAELFDAKTIEEVSKIPQVLDRVSTTLDLNNFASLSDSAPQLVTGFEFAKSEINKIQMSMNTNLPADEKVKMIEELKEHLKGLADFGYGLLYKAMKVFDLGNDSNSSTEIQNAIRDIEDFRQVVDSIKLT